MVTNPELIHSLLFGERCSGNFLAKMLLEFQEARMVSLTPDSSPVLGKDCKIMEDFFLNRSGLDQ